MHAPLRRKLLLINSALVIGLTLVGVAMVYGIRNLRADVTSAADEHAELRLIQQAMFHASLAKTNLDDESRDLPAALEHIQRAAQHMNSFVEFQKAENEASDEHQQDESSGEIAVTKALTTLTGQITDTLSMGGSFDDDSGSALVDAALLNLSRMAVQTDVAEVKAATAELTVTTLFIVGALAALLVAGSMIAAIVCYQSVMGPLRRLRTGVRRIAAGEFSELIPGETSREFAELAADFNHMARELKTLYCDLEGKVQQKSRELVKSERLASVGFLAAGVAHEINNPLNIITGYAELSQRWMLEAKPENLGEVRSALDIIRSEAFRCKGITERLLSLTRVGNSARGEVSLPVLTGEVADMLRGLRKYDDRRLVMRFADSTELIVKGNVDELKQVILNLLVNALEVVDPGTGEVVISGSRQNGSAHVTVQDNGIGMTREVLDRVFEPFFSARNGHRSRGTGLGLSISHNIVESCGGTLRADSDGLGRGSRFILELPLATEKVEHGS